MEPYSKVMIRVCGAVFSMASTQDEAYLHELAEYVDQRMNDIMNAREGGFINTATKSALLALNLADDVFTARKALEEKQRELDDFMRAFDE